MAIVINGSGTVTGITAGGLPDGCVDADTLASGVGGKVLQVVTSSYSTSQSYSSGTYVDSGLSASITPSSTSSKVLIFTVHNGVGQDQNDSSLRGVKIKLFRDGTELDILTKQHGDTRSGSSATFNITDGAGSCSYLDSPSSTSSITYKTQIGNNNGVGTCYAQTDGARSSITLMEIAG